MASAELRTNAESAPIPTARYRTSSSPPGMQGPRRRFMDRSNRDDIIRQENEREHQTEEKRYAFVSNESDLSDIDARGRARSPSPVDRVRTRARSNSRYPSVRVIYTVKEDANAWENYEDFSFDCDKSEALKNSDSLSFDTSSGDPDTSSVDVNRLTDDSRVKQIYYSRYTGDAETGGSHTAQLTEIHNGSGELFKWLYVSYIVRRVP